MEELYKYTLEKYNIVEFSDTLSINRVVYNDPWDIPDGSDRYYLDNLEYDIRGRYNTKEKFEENFKNKLAEVEQNRFSVYITKTDEKISFKVFRYSRTKRLNGKGFRTYTSVRFVTFNHKTNCLYDGEMTNYHSKKKAKKAIHKNNFMSKPLNSMKYALNSMFYGGLSESKLTEAMKDKPEIIGLSMEIFLSNIPGLVIVDGYKSDELLYKRFLDFAGIKYPNNWTTFMTLFPQPLRRDLKKHKLKYVDALMSKHKVSGDKLKRVLHTVKECNFGGLRFAYELFGETFINSQSDDVMKQLLECSIFQHFDVHDTPLSSNKEKLCALEVLKLAMNNHISPSTYVDHISMMRQLLVFEKFTWKSKTYEEFNQEHYELSERVSFYTQGDFYRTYGENFVNTIENSIDLDYVYYPVVLKTSKEYNNESYIQSNCVKTYVREEHSLIISLRREDYDGERITIEYLIGHNGEKVFNLLRVQTLGRFNKSVDDTWTEAIKVLDDRINKFLVEDEFILPTILVKTAGRELECKCDVTNIIKMKHHRDTSGMRDYGFKLKWDKDLSYLNKTTITTHNDFFELF